MSKARRRALAGLTVPQLFNEAQRASDAGATRYAGVLWDLFAGEPERTLEQLLACVAWLLKTAEKTAYITKAIKFVGRVVGLASEPEQAEAVDALLEALLEATGAADHIVRWRACQLLKEVMDNLTAEADEAIMSEQRIEELQVALLERLGDAKPPVRAAAARSMRRLPQLGEEGDYTDCEVTDALLHTLSNDKSREVRRAVLGALPLVVAGPEGPLASEATMTTFLQRTLDEADEVRVAVYAVLEEHVPLAALSASDRLLILQRGLADRSKSVAAAASNMLEQWLAQCAGDAFQLLAQLDVVQNPGVGESVVCALISSGALDAAQLVKRAVEMQEGLHRDFNAAALFTPGEALFWRVMCQELHGEATSKALAAAAAGGGAEAAIERAAAESGYSALEEALPATTEEMAAIISKHAQAGAQYRFATCQLMLLASTCMDFADAASRKAAAAMLHNLVTEVPSNEKDDEEGALLVGFHLASSAWQQALSQFLRKVHSDPVELAESLLGSVGQVAAAAAGEGASSAVWLQALAAAALLLELLPDSRVAERAQSEFRLQDVMDSIVAPALQHEDLLVQQQAMRCLGLYCWLEGDGDVLGGHVELLRTVLIEWETSDRPVELATAAAQALGDLALRKGLKNIDALAHEAGPERKRLLEVLLGTLQHWKDGLQGGGEDSEAELQLGTAVVEALARLLLHNDLWSTRVTQDGCRGLEQEEVIKVLVQLLLLNFDQRADAATQLRQCLAVFFDIFASLPSPLPGMPSSREYLAKALIPAARRAADGDKRTATAANCVSAKVVRFVLQMLEAPAKGPDGQELVVGQEALVRDVLAEINSVFFLGVSQHYLTALCKLPLRLPVVATNETQVSIKQARALAGRVHALITGEKAWQRAARNDLEAAEQRFAQLDQTAEPLGEEEIEELLSSVQQQQEEQYGAYPLRGPEAPAPTARKGPANRGKAPARRKGAKAAESSDEESDNDSEQEQEPHTRRGKGGAAAAPTPATRRMPARSTRITRTLKEDSETGEEDDSESGASSSGSDSEGEEAGGGAENARSAAAAGRAAGKAAGRRASSDSVSELRQALQENRIS